MLTDSEFRVLLDRYQRSWKGYRKIRRTPMKRVSKHMKSLGCGSIQEYLDVLAEDLVEEKLLLSFLRITISRFFRDRKLWISLAETVFPAILQQTNKLKVWSAGCSCGEEVYSLRIQHHMNWSDCSSIEILATDANNECLERAQNGIYQKSSLRELDSNMIATCFLRSARRNEYVVRPAYRKNIVWKHHDFFSAPPDRGFHAIFLRNNLLTYYSPPVQSATLDKILRSLLPGGFLIIGSHEVLPDISFYLIPTACCMVYQLPLFQPFNHAALQG